MKNDCQRNGCLDCVVALVEKGADVNALTSLRQPPIHFAKEKGHEVIADYLLSHGYTFERGVEFLQNWIEKNVGAADRGRARDSELATECILEAASQGILWPTCKKADQTSRP